MILTELRRGIATGIGCQGVAVEERVLRTQQERLHVRFVIIRVGAVGGAVGSCRQFVVGEGIGRESRGRGKESCRARLLCLGEDHEVQRRVFGIQAIGQ